MVLREIPGIWLCVQDRVGLIHQLATLPEHPESVPINRLVAIKVRSCTTATSGAVDRLVAGWGHVHLECLSLG